MFKKIISHLPFSPTLVGQLGFYAKRLSKEQASRRIGLILTALALVVQSLVVFAPPESANAANSTNMINGGVWSQAQMMSAYDNNHNNYKDLFNAIGITRAELLAATKNWQQPRSTDGNYSWGMLKNFSTAQGAGTYTVPATGGGTRTFHYAPHQLWGNYKYGAYVGHSAKIGWFAIMRNCGNLITHIIPPAPKCPTGQVGTYPNCSTPPKKCTIPGKTNLNADDPNCKKDPVASCTALKINNNNSIYQFTASADAQNGAKINGYIFKVYRDGKLVKTLTTSEAVATYTEKTPGKYKVELTVKTSLGEKTASDCAKEFTIPEPERCALNPNLLKDDPKCQPCPGDSTLWIEDEKCSAEFIQTKSAENITQNADATTVVANGGDRITYKLTVKNKGLNEAKFTFQERITDVLEYSKMFDNGGGSIVDDPEKTADDSSDKAKLLTWPEITLKPGETQERVYTVQLIDTIPPMPEGKSDRTSYDCRMDNVFGNTVNIEVNCPTVKVVEQVVDELPRTGASQNMILGGVVTAIVTFLYFRSRQLNKEVRLIRKDAVAGTL